MASESRPQDREARDLDAAHRRTLLVLSICVVGWAAFTALNAAQGRRISASIDAGVTLCMWAVRAWVRPAASRTRVAAHIGAGFMSGGLTAVSMIQGQSQAMASWFLVAAPLMGGYTIGRGAAVGWSVITVVLLAVVHLSSLVVHIPPEFVHGPAEVWMGAALLVVAQLFITLAALGVMQKDMDGITARNALIEKNAAELARARDEALAGTRARDEFLALMSHEIRTPLTGIIGLAELLAASAATAQEREQARTIRASGESLRSILSDILDTVRIEAGRLSIEPRPMALRSTLDNAVQLLGPEARRKGLGLHLTVDDALPEAIVADADRVHQVLVNLLSNAVKFTAHGTISVRAAVAGGLVAVTVQDTGIGIDERTRARLFQPFTQADPSSERRFEGTGLGLSISRRLARLMGGDVVVESEPGRGSTFRFTFALQPAAALPAVCPTAMAGPRSVLVVEDNPVNRQVAVAMLEHLGHRVSAVATGLAALEALEAGHTDVVLLDLRLPGLDGLSVARRIRTLPGADSTRPWLIAYTANASADDRGAAMAAGMNDFLAKPASLDGLAAALAAGPPCAASADGAGRSASDDPRSGAELLVDTAHLEQLLGGVPQGHLDGLLTDYVRDARRLLDAMRAAGDTEVVRRLAHELKGVSANVGAASMAARCRAVEAGTSSGREAMAGALDALEATLARTEARVAELSGPAR